MTRERDRASPLSPDEVVEILAICSPRGLLVGGQALAFWSDHLMVPRPPTLASVVTADADFIGDSTLAEELGTRLGWKTWIPTLDDATPQTGRVTARARDGGIKQVDFLSGVIGLTTKDVERRAVEMEVPRIGLLRVMHPIDLLDSRIQNLHLLPEKRNEHGVAQAMLAIDVARAYIRTEIASRGERAGLRLLERIAAIAEDIGAVRVYLLFGVDPLLAVPVDEFRTTSALHEKRWPQIERAVARKRRALEKVTARKPRR
jgi:hypothetical protein